MEERENRKYPKKERTVQLKSVQFSLAYDAVPIGIGLDMGGKKPVILVAQTDRQHRQHRQIDRQQFFFDALRLARTKLLLRSGFGREVSISFLISDAFTCSSK